MRILAIDTSCDETSAAVTEDNKILSNIIWSQASAHAKFGGVMPSLAQRMHEERIDWVIDKAIKRAKTQFSKIEAVAVTIGPGLSIALGVGIDRAKKIAKEYDKPVAPVNHVEAHILSPLVAPESKGLLTTKTKHARNIRLRFPSLGLVISGGNTVLVKINKIGSYETLATTTDDALGEALDKAARMLGLGYPGGAVLEKIAQLGNPNKFLLPIPLAGQETRQIFSYSGLKTSFYRLIESNKSKDPRFPTKQDIYDLAATFQNIAFTHLTRTISYIIKNSKTRYNDLLVGGGVSANNEIRNRLRRIAKENDIQIHFPYTKKLCGDNAAMIGVTAYLHATAGDFSKDTEIIDRNPNLKLSDIVLK